MMNVAHLDFDALIAFSVFADVLNFSEAARRLHISQPALHVKIRKLSEQLDRTLYQRVGRTLVLTVHGEVVARYSRQLQRSADTFLADLQGGAAQPITLAAGEGAYLYLLGNGIRRFQDESDTPLRLQTADRESSVSLVKSGRAQLGVAPLDASPEGLHSVALANIGQVLAVPFGHRLAARSRVRIRDLAGERLVMPPKERPQRQMLAAMLQAEGVAWEVAIEATGWELMLNFVAMNIGVAVVNACCRVPKGVVAIPMPDLPVLRYQCFHENGLSKTSPVVQLRTMLVAGANTWKSDRR